MIMIISAAFLISIDEVPIRYFFSYHEQFILRKAETYSVVFVAYDDFRNNETLI